MIINWGISWQKLVIIAGKEYAKTQGGKAANQEEAVTEAPAEAAAE